MLTDVGALALAFFAGWMASRPATQRMSYGFYRIEVLSALINGALLLFLSFLILKEAYERWNAETEINIAIMIGIAFIGLVFNLIVGLMLHRFSEKNMNIRAAFFHVASDAISSIGVIVAGGIIALTGWTFVDSLVSAFISLLIIISAWRLLKDVVAVLLEATPSHIDIPQLEKRILAVQGVQSIHDLHVWSLSPGKEALSAHLEISQSVNRDALLQTVNEILTREFKISHTTLQFELPGEKERERTHFHD